MLASLQLTRRMAAVASVSNFIISPGPLQASASTAHFDTRSLLSTRTVHGFSASQHSPFTDSGNGHRVGRFGAQLIHSSEAAQIKTKRTMTSATSELQSDSRQYFALTYAGSSQTRSYSSCTNPRSGGQDASWRSMGDPLDSALFIWLVNSADEVQQFVNEDPYVKNGLVTKFDIRPIAAAVGTWVAAAQK